MSKPHSEKSLDQPRLPVVTPRSIVSLLMVLSGIAWIVFFYTQVRTGVGTAEGGSPKLLADLGNWNYAIAFGLVILGLWVSAHPSSPLGRGRGVVTGMLGSALFGLLWICVYYAFANNLSGIPVFNDLGNYNLVVGISFMALAFAFATRWE